MINMDIHLLEKSEQAFIVEHGLYDNIGKPIKINGENYYPILHKKLFLRYYITYSGCIYDIINKEIKKFNIYDKVILRNTNDDTKNIYKVQELIWRTFYRFPEGQDYPLDNSHNIHYGHHFENGTQGFYIINGVEFRKILFPKESPYYKSFTKNGRYILVASENGAVFDIRKRRFLLIQMDSTGTSFILGKMNARINIEKVLLFSWHTNLQFNQDTQTLLNISPLKAFVDRFNILTCNKNISNFEINNRLLVTQNISAYQSIEYIPRSFTSASKWTLDDLGSQYKIPIEGLSEYTITRCGIIFYENGKILQPYKIIGKRDNVLDVIYKFPDVEGLYSILDILLWVFYRLNYSAVIKQFSKIILHKSLSVPVVIQQYFVSKPPQIGGEYTSIGDMLFTRLKGFPNLFISTSGAIFNAKHKYFIQINNIGETSDNVSCNVPIGSECKWIDLPSSMYTCWYGNIPSSMNISQKNRIVGDTRLSNIALNIINPTCRSNKINMEKIKKSYTILKSTKDRNLKSIRDIFEINGMEYNEDDFPILEIIEI